MFSSLCNLHRATSSCAGQADAAFFSRIPEEDQQLGNDRTNWKWELVSFHYLHLNWTFGTIVPVTSFTWFKAAFAKVAFTKPASLETTWSAHWAGQTLGRCWELSDRWELSDHARFCYHHIATFQLLIVFSLRDNALLLRFCFGSPKEEIQGSALYVKSQGYLIANKC